MMEAQEAPSPPPFIPPPCPSQRQRAPGSFPGIRGLRAIQAPLAHCALAVPTRSLLLSKETSPAPCQQEKFLGKLPPLLPINCFKMPPLLHGWKCHSWGHLKIIPSFLGQPLPSSTAEPTCQEELKGEEACSGTEMPSTELLVWSRLECH